MAYAVVDLRAGANADEFLSTLEQELRAAQYADRPLEAWVTEVDGRERITLCADFGNIWLGQLIARAGASGAVERAVVGLDHDEYGVEHVVLDGRGGGLVRVHHVYVYPDDEPDEEYVPVLAGLPARPDLASNPDGTLTGVDALAVAAALYGVGADAMATAVRETADAYENLQIVFAPLEPWWRALRLTYPGELGEPTRVMTVHSG
jgi:hypothetical protein